MTDSMVYTVAMAMKAAMAGCTAQDLQQLKTTDAMLEHLARAAIGALREPTQQMLSAADDLREDKNYSWLPEIFNFWQAMIDEALRN